ncbi:DNA primase [Halobaculum sp. CBA1158]|uniref:DNA primase n=1 Tax=Halobaculum sp. CBA1158 TaxID=2904243 RepID=UPI001F46AA8A|nr:DNA primase [Halobaculum sp. CBA1158]UIO99830.1 DNA primase [Halobaculum sp. CBA1158]
MEPRHARYPFFATAREAVRESGVDLAALVADGDPAVDRGRERVERALTEGTVEADDPVEWDARDELLSYPIARILVSLLDSHAAVEKYADAEARTAYRRFTEDLDRERSGDARPDPAAVDRDALLREFDLDGAVRAEAPKPGQPEGKWLWLGVGAYLSYVDPEWGDDWRLVNRDLADGEVRAEREELYRLLREAVRDRVADGLPFEGVGDDLAAELEAEISDLRDLLADRSVRADLEVVAPEHFPPCIAKLLGRAQAGDDLDSRELFSLLAFLAGLNLESDEVVALTSLGPDLVADRFAYLRDESGAQYPPPSCRTLGEYGICDNEDNHRSVAPHPMEYYSRQLRQADDVVDWRDRAGDGDGTDSGRGASGDAEA